MSPRTGGAEVVVDHVSRSFEDGSIAALADVTLPRRARVSSSRSPGPSGCGKSTLLNLIGALDRARLRARSTVARRARRPTSTGRATAATVVGFVFQFHNLIPTLTAAENVQLPMLGRRTRARASAWRARASLLDEVGLSAPRDRPTRPTLSGGERQRVAIARALANEPRLLLADEPTGALDTATGEQIVELLERVRAQRGTTILLVTNDPDVAARRRPDPADPRRADRRDHSRRSASIGVSADRPPRGVERAEQRRRRARTRAPRRTRRR